MIEKTVKLKQISGFPRYFVSNDGYIYKKVGTGESEHGYKCARLSVKKAGGGIFRKTFQVHRLVLRAFKGEPPFKGAVCNHINGEKTDNVIENLEWVTIKENVRHAWRTGLNKSKKGSEQAASKLKEKDIPLVRDCIEKGESYQKIAKKFNVSPTTIGDIKANRKWSHV